MSLKKPHLNYFLLFICTFTSLTCIIMLSGVYNMIFKAILHMKYQVTPGSDSEDMWINTPVPMIMKLYIFNITNPDEFLNGAKPVLQELGPYVYREIHVKENVQYHKNKTVTYFQKRSWVWDAELSGDSSPDDYVITMNTIPVSSAFSVEDSSMLLMLLNTFMNRLDEKPLVRTTSSELIFDGYTDPILDFMNDTEFNIPIPEGLKEYDKFAWFYKRNNSVKFDGVYNMFTGERSLDEIGLIDWWNYANTTIYYDSPCNEIKGSAGEFWPPGLKRDFIQFYNSDLCMSPKLYFLEDTTNDYGFSAYRFSGTQDTFDNGSKVKENECFCLDGKCKNAGILNAKNCRMGSPAYISFPHFLNSDSSLLENVIGLQPDPDKHRFFIDIIPDFGIPIKVAARMQINLHVKPYCWWKYGAQIDILKNVPDVILPMIWFEVLTEINDDLANDLRPAFFFSSIAPTIIFSVMLFISFIGIVLIIRKLRK